MTTPTTTGDASIDTTDPTVLCALLEAQGYLVLLWGIEDVQAVRPDLTDAQCLDVLKRCERQYDANMGLTWDVLSFHADDLFPTAEEDSA